MEQYVRMSLLFVLLAVVVQRAEGHGKLMDPIGRNALFNYQRSPVYPNWKTCQGDGSHINTNDAAQNCGGAWTQHSVAKGQCGACGDLATLAYPRKHDYRGAKAPYNQPTRGYKEGELIKVDVYITAAHKGGFEFRLCTINERFANPNPGDKNDVLTQCYTDKTSDFHQLLSKPNDQKVYTSSTGSIDKTKHYIVEVQLPAGVTCPQGCSFQWWYKAGNNYGDVQEHFVNCADIVIGSCADYVNGNINVTNICGYGLSPGAEECVANNGQDSSSTGSSQSNTGYGGDSTSGYNGGTYGEPANTGSCNCDCSKYNTGTQPDNSEQSYGQTDEWGNKDLININNQPTYEEYNGWGDQTYNNQPTYEESNGWGSQDNAQPPQTQAPPPPPPPPTTTTTTTTTTTPRPVITGDRCSNGMYSKTTGYETWCRNNCLHLPSYCPTSLCCGKTTRSLKVLLERVLDLEKSLEEEKRGGGYGK